MAPAHRRSLPSIDREEQATPPRGTQISETRMLSIEADASDDVPWYAKAILRSLAIIDDGQRDVRARVGKAEELAPLVSELGDWAEDTKTRQLKHAAAVAKWSERTWKIFGSIVTTLLLLALLALGSRISCTGTPMLNAPIEVKP